MLIAHAFGVLKVDGLAAYWTVRFTEQPSAGQALTLLTGVFNPGVAVVFFFVLSGYVLALSLQRERGTGWIRAYAIRRAFRLLPAMWVSLVLMWLCLKVVPRPNSYEDYALFFVNVFGRQVDAHDMMANIFLYKNRVNPVTWTMTVEVIGSVFVPVSMFLCARYGRASAWVLWIAAFLATLLTEPSSRVFHFILCFQSGVMLASGRKGEFFGTGSASPAFMLGSAILALVLEGVVAPELSLPLRTLFNTGIAIGLMVAVIRGAADRVLNLAPARFSGRISYGLYLFHPPVLHLVGLAMVALGITGSGLRPHLLTVGVGVLVTLLVAALGYMLVERPAMAAGRALAKQVQGMAIHRATLSSGQD